MAFIATSSLTSLARQVAQTPALQAKGASVFQDAALVDLESDLAIIAPPAVAGGVALLAQARFRPRATLA